MDSDFEEAYLGNALVSNPANNLKRINLDLIANNQSFNIIGIFDTIKKIKDRNGNQMAFCSLSTGNGAIEVVFFANQYKIYKSFIKKHLICNFNLKKNNDSFIVNNVELSTA